MQGAGGVGGLLGVNGQGGGGFYFSAYDGNGNVMALVRGSDGYITARYDYGPFGEPMRLNNIVANPTRFSTKFTDEESDFVYYGLRYYNPSTGRWLSRDPIAERGGPNLYGYVGNSPSDRVDPLGLVDFHWYNPISWYWPGYNGPTYAPPLPLPDRNPPITFGALHDQMLGDDGVAGFYNFAQNVHDTATVILELTLQNTVSVVGFGESLGGEKIAIGGRVQCAATSSVGLAYLGGKVYKITGALFKRLKGKSAKEIEKILTKEWCAAERAYPNAEKRSYRPHIKGKYGEQQGWEQALDSGHVPIRAPHENTTTPGVPDFITYDPQAGVIVV